MWPAGPASVEGSSSSLSARGSLGCSRKIFANASALRDRDGVRDDRESGVLAAMRGWRRRLGGERRCWHCCRRCQTPRTARPVFASLTETERHLDGRPARLQLTRREVFHLSPFVQKYVQSKHVAPDAKLSSAQVGFGRPTTAPRADAGVLGPVAGRVRSQAALWTPAAFDEPRSSGCSMGSVGRHMDAARH